ncbi:hypothetical protein ACFFK0_07645 [Paenibacillus chartarius]|uniref:Gliding motility protein n=1 Tax=Paenibacillus chartarius TaxID=747481 RepID=A0ABV6DI83_9BACL
MKVPEAGDVYCVYSRHLRMYTACQITLWEPPKSKRDKGTAWVVGLDWAGERPLTPDEMPGLKPLLLNHHHYSDDYDALNIHAYIPSHYQYIGTMEPLLTGAPRAYSFGGWNEGLQYKLQKRWDRLPLALRQSYRQANTLPSVQIGDVNMSANTQRVSAEVLRQFADPSELSRFPRLTDLQTDSLTDSLLEYIAGSSMISALLVESGHGKRRIDVSGTSLLSLRIHVDDAEEIVLNPGLRELTLVGSVSSPLRIDAEGGGESLRLNVTGHVPHFAGLERLGALSIWDVTELDLAQIASRFGALKELTLRGKPGLLTGLRHLRRCSGLQRLNVSDLFGFDVADFPGPEELPQLTWISMDSFPGEAAKVIKDKYKQEPYYHFYLDLTKPRKPEWLAENVDNPFRDWDGREDISEAQLKKVSDLYKKTRRAMIAAVRQSGEAAEADLKSLVIEYTEFFNRFDERTGFIETVEREEVFEALEQAIRVATDREELIGMLLDVFDETRDF